MYNHIYTYIHVNTKTKITYRIIHIHIYTSKYTLRRTAMNLHKAKYHRKRCKDLVVCRFISSHNLLGHSITNVHMQFQIIDFLPFNQIIVNVSM